MAHIQEERSLKGKLSSATASEERSLIDFRYLFMGSQNSCLHLFGNIPTGVPTYLTSQQSSLQIIVLIFKQQLQKLNKTLTFSSTATCKYIMGSPSGTFSRSNLYCCNSI